MHILMVIFYTGTDSLFSLTYVNVVLFFNDICNSPSPYSDAYSQMRVHHKGLAMAHVSSIITGHVGL